MTVAEVIAVALLTNDHPCDPAQRFQSWHRRRPVEDYAEYEAGYRASYADVVALIAARGAA